MVIKQSKQIVDSRQFSVSASEDENMNREKKKANTKKTLTAVLESELAAILDDSTY